MTGEVFSLLLDKRTSELNGKAAFGKLTRIERAELRALEIHQDKSPAVLHRIRILSAKMAQPNRWGMLMLRFSKKFKQNLAELESLVQYGHSRAVWEIAYLQRCKATRKLSREEASELRHLLLFHDSPDVLHIANLKMKEDLGTLSADEAQELLYLQRNPYRKEGIPGQLLEMFKPAQSHPELDFS